jgi:glycosyltransferase involved in cell wall biosynthesis
MSDKIHIALLMMVKDEEETIIKTINTVIGTADSVIIYDTGSTDKTLEIIREICETHDIPLHIKEGMFTNFSISRNESLDYANSILGLDYILLLDANDELIGGKFLREYAEKFKDEKNTGFCVRQEWYEKNMVDAFFTVRFIKAYSDWKYNFMPVHETMYNSAYASDAEAIESGDIAVTLDTDTIKIYQDRTHARSVSNKRMERDKIMLLDVYEKDPKNSRVLYYLAQTCSCLDELTEAYNYYKLRTEIESAFTEETFHAHLHCGDIAFSLNYPWSVSEDWFLKAYEICNRLEPVIKIAEYYVRQSDWEKAYKFICITCDTEYKQSCIMSVNKIYYEYTRWALKEKIAYNLGKYEEGKKAIVIALESGINILRDQYTLMKYLDKDIILTEYDLRYININREEIAYNIISEARIKENFNAGVNWGDFLCKYFQSIKIMDEYAICLQRIGQHRKSYEIYQKLLTQPLSDTLVEAIRFNQHFSIKYIEDEFITPNPSKIQEVTNILSQPKLGIITITMTSCKRLKLFKATVSSFIECCLDLHLVQEWICVDDNSAEEDRSCMTNLFPFIRFINKTQEQRGHGESMNIIRNEVRTPYFFHLEDDWKFYEKRQYMTDCLDVLNSTNNTIANDYVGHIYNKELITIGQCVVNVNYSLTHESICIKGGHRMTTERGMRFVLHEYCPTDDEKIAWVKKHGQAKSQCHWPHFSLNPSMIRTSALKQIGPFENRPHFEGNYAQKYTEMGFMTAYLDGIHCRHSGDVGKNAYALNDMVQWLEKLAKA